MVLHVIFWLWNCLGGETGRERTVNQDGALGIIADAYGGKWDLIYTGNSIT